VASAVVISFFLWKKVSLVRLKSMSDEYQLSVNTMIHNWLLMPNRELQYKRATQRKLHKHSKAGYTKKSIQKVSLNKNYY
jgi:hypothetical protein